MHYAEAFAVSLPLQSFGIDVFPPLKGPSLSIVGVA